MALVDDGAPAHIQINPPLPCGIADCRQPAMQALAEPTPDDPALWQLLPICEDCMTRLQAEARGAGTQAQKL
jgi:hypothetical protein